jgi:SHS2 domain-containing protein
MTWRHVSHTADVGIEVQAATREELFTGAAEALTALLVEPGTSVEGEQVEVPVSLPAGDDASLLRDWLAEVLVAFELNGVVGRDFSVAIGPDGLRGTIRGERFEPGRHSLGMEVKAVTYHGLEVGRTADGWRAAVLLDV